MRNCPSGHPDAAPAMRPSDGLGARPPLDNIRQACRAAAMIAEVVQRTLHEDPRLRGVWLRPGARPGSIDIGGEVANRSLLALLDRFAEEWGGIDVDVDIRHPRQAPGIGDDCRAGTPA